MKAVGSNLSSAPLFTGFDEDALEAAWDGVGVRPLQILTLSQSTMGVAAVKPGSASGASSEGAAAKPVIPTVRVGRGEAVEAMPVLPAGFVATPPVKLPSKPMVISKAPPKPAPAPPTAAAATSPPTRPEEEEEHEPEPVRSQTPAVPGRSQPLASDQLATSGVGQGLGSARNTALPGDTMPNRRPCPLSKRNPSPRRQPSASRRPSY